MGRSNSFRWGAIASLFVLVSVALDAGRVTADPGSFWYGLYYIRPEASIAREMANRYRMNWALTDVTDNSGGILDTFDNLGIGIMQWHPRPGNSFDGAFVFDRYGNASHLTVQAEPDTILYQWNAYHDEVYDKYYGVYTRYSGGEGDISGYVGDALASNGFAWLFHPTVHAAPDSIYLVNTTLNRRGGARGTFRFTFNIRMGQPGCSGSDTLAILQVRTHTPDCQVLDDSTITCQELADNLYHEFVLQHFPGPQTYLELVVHWTGEAKLYVDWFRIEDQRGNLLASGQADVEIIDYMDEYRFGNHPAIIGVYMYEEVWGRPECRPAGTARESNRMAGAQALHRASLLGLVG